MGVKRRTPWPTSPPPSETGFSSLWRESASSGSASRWRSRRRSRSSYVSSSQRRWIAFLAIVSTVAVAACVLTGCGPKQPRGRAPGSPDDRVGPLCIIYHDASGARTVPPLRRTPLLRFLDETFSRYCDDFGWSSPPPVLTHVYLGLASGVPCGIPNGGGCYTLWSGLHLAEYPVAGAEWVWRHEFNHYRLHALGGDLDSDHGDPSWARLR